VTKPIRLGTRASTLARTQSATVGAALSDVSQRPWLEVLVRTLGDDTSKSLDQPGTSGLFVSTLRRALIAGEVDVIVHSFKDLPSAPEPGIVLAAVPVRADPRDALVSRDGLHFAELPAGSIIGTSSPRREAAMKRLRPDLVFSPIRGNVETRISRVREGQFAATVLAVAGLTRIGRTIEIAEILEDILPAPAQGALAVECRENDIEMLSLVSTLNDTQARLVTAAERYVLVGINADCTTAVAAFASYAEGQLRLRAELTLNGHHTSADLTQDCAPDDLAGARSLGLRASALLAGSERPVLLIRSENNESDAESLGTYGIASITEPYVRITPVVGDVDADELLELLRTSAGDRDLAQNTWVVATSPMTVPSWIAAAGRTDLLGAVATAVAAGVRAAATGERTAETLRELGFTEVRIPQEASARGLVADLASVAPGRALFPRGNLALRTLPEGLRELNWEVKEGVVYRTESVAERPASADMIERSQVSLVVVRSPSAVRALVSHVQVPASVPVVCAGRTTAEAAIAAGLSVAAIADSPGSVDVARAVSALLDSALFNSALIDSAEGA